MEHREIPVGFEMALAQNPEAMRRFALLPERQRQKILDGTHSIHSAAEMRQYVSRILSDE